jgi:uracil-DNA glycosylase family 4
LGRIAAEHLLQKKIRITKEHGEAGELPGYPHIRVVVVFHPAYVLRNRKPEVEKAFYEDIAKAREVAYEVSDSEIHARGTRGSY